MTGGSTLVEQCRLILEADPSTKCMVYRNAELALSWQEEQRAIMYDPAYAGFFVQVRRTQSAESAVVTVSCRSAGMLFFGT
jgi:hypothetical protein